MKIKLSLKYIITFLALTFLMHELHEIVHTTVGRIIFGCWGERDFNQWSTCDVVSPLGYIATAAGPIFTFIMIWIGAGLLKEKNTIQQKTLGFSLIFANIPFARLITPLAFGGGDEVTVLDYFVENWELSRIIICVLILFLTAIPLYKAFKIMPNKHKIILFLLFYLLPTIIDGFVLLGGMNTLLNNGILNSYWILGSPILVTVWTLAVTTIFILSYKNLFLLAKEDNGL